MLTLEYECEIGGEVVMGIDEAGRGPLAGPVFAAAVSLPLDIAAELLSGEWQGVNDSKKLTEKKRDALSGIIRSTPGCLFAVASATAEEIDEHNILRATHLAMRRAALDLAAQCAHLEQTINAVSSPFRILVDGLRVPTLPFPSRNIIKGDAKSPFIAAASILAKTARDAYCHEMEDKYPGYDFAVHKGYPTKLHMERLAKLGACPEHRKSFRPVREVLLPELPFEK